MKKIKIVYMTKLNEDIEANDKINYEEQFEYLIKCKGEQCQILSTLHLLSHKKYKKQEIYFNIPIITITGLVGFIAALNIQFDYINIIIGALSFFVSLLKSYFSFLQISQKNENHRVAYLQYVQIANEIRIELSLSREMRQPASYLLNLIKVKMKNLNEVSEIIPTPIIEKFKNTHGPYLNPSIISLPDVIFTLQPIEIFKDNSYDQNELKEIIEAHI